MTRATIAVMARPLVPGAVKTRLARTLGDEGALAVYERLLRGTLAAAEQVRAVDLALAEAPAADGSGAPAAAGTTAGLLTGREARWSRLRQRGVGLGERLANVFADLFTAGAPAVVIAGSDSPALPAEYLEQAVAELRAGGVVLGPAADGGYYLVGTTRETWAAHGAALSALLAASPMSSARLLDHTLRALRSAGIRVRGCHVHQPSRSVAEAGGSIPAPEPCTRAVTSVSPSPSMR